VPAEFKSCAFQNMAGTETDHTPALSQGVLTPETSAALTDINCTLEGQ
jgi:hypothetical protein